MKLILVLLIFSSSFLFAHPGKTNAKGCHIINRATGEFHCHKKGRRVMTPSFEKALISGKSICCKVCKKGKACGDTCISKRQQCRRPVGCACDR